MEWLDDAPTLFVILVAVIITSVVTVVARSEQAEQAEIRRQRDKYLESKEGRVSGEGLPFPVPKLLLNRREKSRQAAKEAWARARANESRASAARLHDSRPGQSPQRAVR